MAFPTLGAPAPAIGAKVSDIAIWLSKARDVVNNIMRGKLNVLGTLTLTANAATTTLTDTRIGGSTVFLLQAHDSQRGCGDRRRHTVFRDTCAGFRRGKSREQRASRSHFQLYPDRIAP